MRVTINDMRGVNSTTASLQLKPGEVELSQNIRNRPFNNWNKREGVEFVSSDTQPINGIWELDFDGLIIPVFQAGGTLTFYPDISSQNGTMPNPDPYPYNPLDPENNYLYILLLIEPAMRAANERWGRINFTGRTYPKRFFNDTGFVAAGESPPTISGAGFYTGSTTQYSWPPNNFYRFDLANYDTHFGLPPNTRAAQLVNEIRSCINDDTLLNFYLNTGFAIQGASSITRFNTVSLPIPAAALPSTYRSRLVDLRTAIRKLKFVTESCSVGLSTAAIKVDNVSIVGTQADAASCALSQLAGVPYGSHYDYTTGCAFAGSSASASFTNGIRTLRSTSGGNSSAEIIISLQLISSTISAYPNIESKFIYGFFTDANSIIFPTYYSPATFNSPPINTFGLIAANVSSYTITDSDATDEVTAMMAVPNSGLGWTVASAVLVIQLGFTQGL